MAAKASTPYPEGMAEAQDMLTKQLGSGVDEAKQEELREMAQFDTVRAERYKTAETYYDGAQPKYIDDRLRAFLEVSGIPYGENFCETVVDALVERLSVIGFSSENEKYADWLWTDWYDSNVGDVLQLTLHLETAKKGDGYIILDWDADKNLCRAYFNRPEGICPCYHEGDLTHVIKVWDCEDKSPTNPKGERIRRMNLYYPDRVEKWFAVSGEGRNQKQVWGRWMDDGDKVWPIDWTYQGKPLGIPVFHFANKARGDHMGRPEHYGTIPQQDRLTKELLDLASIMDQLGYPQRYATGFAGTNDLKTAPGEVWSTPSEGGAFGQFDAANPDGPLGAVNATLQRIATRSNTPAHRFTLTGGYPSGEALKVSEAGLVAKCRNRQTTWGGTWAEMCQMATAITIVFAGGSGEGPGVTMDELMKTTVNVTWADAESRNEKEHLETLGLMHELGVSKTTLLAMMPGIDPVKEKELRQAEDEEGAARGAQMMGMGLLPPKDPNAPLSKADAKPPVNGGPPKPFGE